MIGKILKKKAKRIFPAAVEGKFFHRIGVAWKEMATAVDRKIGYLARCILSRTSKTVPNRILFMTFQHDYACNPSYICDELLRRGDELELVWAVDDGKRKNLPDDPRIRPVKVNSYDYFAAAASAKVIIINSLLGDKFYPFPVRKDQAVVETWHGSLGIKRFDPAHYNTNVSWPEAAKKTGRRTTVCISNSQFEEDVFTETFWAGKPMLRLGHARNDVFFSGFDARRGALKEAFLEKYGLESDTRFVLYAPTFRDSHNFEVYDLDAERTVAAFAERFGGSWKLLVRYHFNDVKTEAKKNKVKSPDVIDVTKYPDIQQLLSFIDAGITDYSSWIFDFVMSRKPGFIYARDAELYNNERGFYFTLEESPFPVAHDNDEMEAAVLSFDEKAYLTGVESFLKEKEAVDDGRSSERIADYVLSLVKEK